MSLLKGCPYSKVTRVTSHHKGSIRISLEEFDVASRYFLHLFKGSLLRILPGEPELRALLSSGAIQLKKVLHWRSCMCIMRDVFTVVFAKSEKTPELRHHGGQFL